MVAEFGLRSFETLRDWALWALDHLGERPPLPPSDEPAVTRPSGLSAVHRPGQAAPSHVAARSAIMMVVRFGGTAGTADMTEGHR